MIYPHGQLRGYRGLILNGGCAVALLLSAATSARAMNIVEPISTAPAGGTGSFEVDCVGTSQPAWLDGFSLDITVPTGITITSADIDTADPYVFGSVQSPPFVQSMTSDSVEVADSFPYYLDYTAVDNGDAFGLVNVYYSVAPTALPGSYFVAYPSTTFGFAYGVIGTISIPSSSTITVTVPEPATLGMLPLAGMALRPRRGRRA